MAVLLLFVSSVSVMAENEDIGVKDIAVMSYSVTPKPVVLNEPVEVSLKIKNVGNMNIHEDFVIEFQACKPGGSGCNIPEGAEINGLAVGAEKTITRNFYLSENDVVNGKALIMFVADGDGHVDEIDESNNVYSMLINVIEEAPVVEVTGGPVQFNVAVNDYPDHQDYGLSENIKYAYVNMYTVELEGDAFEVVDTETKKTGSSAAATFTIQPGEMVYFEGFKTENGAGEGAENKEALLWTAPPYKNFGEGKICQTHWTETNEYLKYSQDYACATSLSTPYKDLGSEPAIPTETLKLVVKDNVKGAYLDWNDMSGLGDTFDKYNIQFKKGKSLVNPADSYVSFSYYNLIDLQPGDYWTFKICPTKNKQIVGDCSNTVTVLIKDGVQTVEVVDKVSEYLIWTYDNNKPVRAIVAKYQVDPNNHFKGKLVETQPAKLTEDYKGNEFYQANLKVKEDEIVTFISFKEGLTPPKTSDNVKEYPGYHNVLINSGFKDKWGIQALCKYAQKSCNGGLTGEGQQILFSTNPGNDNFVKPVNVPSPVVIPRNSQPDFTEKIEQFPVDCLSGCAYENKCLPVGTKIKENGDSLFCDWNGRMKEQLSEGNVCQNDYECESNSCMSGKCLDLEKKLSQQQNLLERILSWMEKFFN